MLCGRHSVAGFASCVRKKSGCITGRDGIGQLQETADQRPRTRDREQANRLRAHKHPVLRPIDEFVDKAVAEAIATKTPLDQLDLTAIDPAYGPDAKDAFSLETALAARTNPGAPSVSNVKAEISRWLAAFS